MTQKQTVVLTMIVKNEEKVIERCLFSCLRLIDYFVICDTGSTDKTIEVINRFSEHYGLKGEVHQHEWKNFEHNRNLSLEIAKTKGDYIYWMDADDIIEFESNWKRPTFTRGAYVMDIIYNPVHYKRVHLVRSNVASKWIGVLHECLIIPPETDVEIIQGVKMVIVGGGGGRNTDPQKHQKDAVVLEKALKDEPNNARYMFYLAQSYRNYQDYDNAIMWYQKRSDIEEHAEERCYAKYQVGILKMLSGKYQVHEYVFDLLLAHSYYPLRLEPLFYAVAILNKNKLHEVAYNIGIRHIHEKEPEPVCMLFTENEVYAWKLPFETAYAAFQQEKYVEALLLYLHLYFNGKNTDDQKKQLQQNISACCNKMGHTQTMITKKQIYEFLDKTQENNIRKLFYA